MARYLCMCRKFIFYIWIFYKDIESLKVKMNPDITASTGISNVLLKCYFTYENNESGGIIKLMARNKTSNEEFFQIAAFYGPTTMNSAVLTQRGRYLLGRVKLENPTTSLPVAVLSFAEVQCIDDTDYRCDITYYILGEELREKSNSTKLIITSQPSKPDIITLNSTLHEVLDGQSVLFTCRGYVGKPPGKFIYRKYRYNEQFPINFSDVVTTFEEVSDRCTFYGTSNLTIQLTHLDNKATIECVERSFASSDNTTVKIGPFNVYYKVRGITITKSPDMEIYQASSVDNVNLTCKADGNPLPKYDWRQKENPSLILSTEHVLIINNMTVNKSGNYVCRAYHNINGNLYTETKQISITIVSGTEASLKDSDSDTIYASIISTCLLMTISLTLVVVCFAIKRRKTRAADPSYTASEHSPNEGLHYINLKITSVATSTNAESGINENTNLNLNRTNAVSSATVLPDDNERDLNHYQSLTDDWKASSLHIYSLMEKPNQYENTCLAVASGSLNKKTCNTYESLTDRQSDQQVYESNHMSPDKQTVTKYKL